MNFSGWMKGIFILSLYVESSAKYIVDPVGITNQEAGRALAGSIMTVPGATEPRKNKQTKKIGRLPKHFDPFAKAVAAWLTQEAGFRLVIIPRDMAEDSKCVAATKMFGLNERQLSNPPAHAARVLWGAIWPCFQGALNEILAMNSTQRLVEAPYVGEAEAQRLDAGIGDAFEKVNFFLDMSFQVIIKEQGQATDLERVAGLKRIALARARDFSKEDMGVFMTALKQFKHYAPLPRTFPLHAELIKQAMKRYGSRVNALKAIGDGSETILLGSRVNYRLYPEKIIKGVGDKPPVLAGFFVKSKLIATPSQGLQAFLLDALFFQEEVKMRTRERLNFYREKGQEDLPSEDESLLSQQDMMVMMLMGRRDFASFMAPEWQAYHDERICGAKDLPKAINLGMFFKCHWKPNSPATPSPSPAGGPVYAGTIQARVTPGGGIKM